MFQMEHLAHFFSIFFGDTMFFCYLCNIVRAMRLDENMIIKTPSSMEQIESKHSIIAEYYTSHYDELKKFVASRLLFADEAEDIVQNVFMRLLQMDKMITTITLPCLVYTVARNLIFDYWRHRSKVEEYEHLIQKSDLGYVGSNDVESIFCAHEVEEELEHSIARLSQKQAKIYRLHIYDGMAVSEIADKLSLKYKNVEYCLGSARKEVRNYMKKVLAS